MFGCVSKCETITLAISLAISLVSLICNISLLRENQHHVAIPALHIFGSSGSTGPGVGQGSDRSAVELISCSLCGWCFISAFSSERSARTSQDFVFKGVGVTGAD